MKEEQFKIGRGRGLPQMIIQNNNSEEGKKKNIKRGGDLKQRLARGKRGQWIGS